MSKYYVYNGQIYSEDELKHIAPIASKASPLKGIEKENHKYIKREWKNNRWVYTYPEDLAGKKPTSTVSKTPVASKSTTTTTPKTSSATSFNVNLGRSAVDKMLSSSSRAVSGEYEDEVEYNTKKNVYPGQEDKEKQNEKSKDNNKSEDKSKSETQTNTKPDNVSDEYWQELQSNSKENVYPEKVIEENVLNENVITENVITEKDSLPKTETEKNWWDDFVKGLSDAVDWLEDLGSKTIDAIVDASEHFAKDASDWANDLFENSHTDYVEAKKQSDAALKNLDAASSEYISTMNTVTKLMFDENATEEEIEKAKAEHEAALEALMKADEEAYKARIEYINAKNNPLRQLDDLIADITNRERTDANVNEESNLALSDLARKDDEEEVYTANTDMSLVNPGYSNEELKQLYNDNCAVCTATYDLRRRGYDVEAGSDAVTMADGYEGLTVDEIASFYEGCTRSDFVYERDLEIKYGKADNMKYMLEYLEKDFLEHGDGARGNLCVIWNGGGGHSMSIEVENGKVVVRDAQTNQLFELSYFAPYIQSVSYLRTDNLEFSDEILKYVHNRKEDK